MKDAEDGEDTETEREVAGLLASNGDDDDGEENEEDSDDADDALDGVQAILGSQSLWLTMVTSVLTLGRWRRNWMVVTSTSYGTSERQKPWQHFGRRRR